MKLKILIFAIVLISSMALYAIEIGTATTDFSLKSLEGKEFSLSSMKGKVVVLDFWASWCAPCREEFPFLIDLANENKDKDFTILAVNIDKKAENAKKFIDKQKSAPIFPILSDPESKIPAIYKVENMPTTFIIDKKGNIRYIHKGFAESYKEVYRKQINELLSEK